MASSEADVGIDDYGLREACGLFGCVANARGGVPSDLDVSHTLHMGLVGVQHRGQESAGIVTSSGKPNAPFCVKKSMGLVNTAFHEEDLQKLKGNIGIGHTRYSTQGDSDHINIQPFIVETLQGRIAVAHNGELVNAKALKRKCVSNNNFEATILDNGEQLGSRWNEKKVLLHGVGLSTGSDSELLTQLLTHQPECGEPDGADWLARIKKVMEQAVISYSLLIMLSDKVYAVRDPFGNRPLCLGKLLPASAFGRHAHYDKREYGDNELDGWVVSSESCAFNAVGAVYHREVLPGEVVEITSQGFKSKLIMERPKEKPPAFCFFEYVYFARPDSFFEGQMVYTVRKRCGKQLAIEAPVEADLVSTVPDSATPAAIEYAHRLGIPFENVLCKNTYVGRTFIQPTTRLRQLGVAKKFGPLFDNLEGKRVVLIDDSIVRGNTMGSIVRLLKRSGAKEVHIRVASPPIKYPCYMGINIPTREELIANVKSVEEIREHIGADTLHYLSIEGLLQAVEEGVDKSKPYGHCLACLTGDYPVTPEW